MSSSQVFFVCSVCATEYEGVPCKSKCPQCGWKEECGEGICRIPAIDRPDKRVPVRLLYSDDAQPVRISTSE